MATPADVHLEQYRQIKTEQIARIGTRDNFIFVNMTAIAVVGGFALQTGWLDLVLAGAGGVLQLGWVFFANDRKIGWVRNYIRADLRYSVAAEVGDMPPHTVFGWESVRRQPGLLFFRLGGLWFDLNLFVLPPAAALVWWAGTRWDRTLTSPLVWVWLWLAMSTVMVTVAALVSTVGRKPHGGGQ